jgi:hypothetical protein
MAKRKMSANSLKNLKPFEKLEGTENEQRIKKVKAGIKSGIKRKEKKIFEDALKVLMKQPVNYEGKKVKANIAVLKAQIKAAIGGSVQHAMFLRDTSGEKPKEHMEITEAPPAIIDDIK